MMERKEKIKLEDLTEKDFEAAKEIVNSIMAMQTLPPEQRLILPIINAIKKFAPERKLNAGLYDGLHAGLDDGVYDGLNDGLNDGLYAGLYDGLYDGLNDGVYAGLRAGLDDGLHAGLHAGLYAGLYAGLDDGLHAGLHAGLRAGLDDGLHAGLHAGLYDGLYDGLHAGLDDGVYDGLYDGLHAGLDDGVYDGLNDKLPIKIEYVGIFWSFWLARYLIARAWGCPLDENKLSLLYGFCRHTPIVVTIANKIFAVKPTKIKWQVAGQTDRGLKLPIYQLHSDGESTVECLGVKLFFHKNIKIPEKYGAARIKDWDANWILTEQNQEIKRLLIENIDKEKITEVLKLKTLDKWKSLNGSEYELVEALNNPFPSRYRALRMTCPTTNKPYLIRVHPDTNTAETAVVRFNKGIHPDTFLREQ